MLSTASQLLAAGVLAAFANTASTASTANDGRHPHDRHTATVRRAIAFMEDHAASPISGAGIAGRWGFLHPGRFAAVYKATYGHPPSETLRT
ncbi:hypothetical protein [Actinomadura nitritigenes]|uniref:hypothetical protein n=1 Tax=Actinomadura nitritigenes TaxID=134602 RepID=UPI003D8CA146